MQTILMRPERFVIVNRIRVVLASVLVLVCCISSLLCKAHECLAQELARAQAGYQWSFPRDHGRHQSFQTEWWYYTGQLYSNDRQPFKDTPDFGFQLTFFRRTEMISGKPVSEYMAHVAVTDVAGGVTHFSSRLGGGALGLAATSPDSLSSVSGDWSVDSIANKLVLRFSTSQRPQSAPLEMRILTEELPPVWLQGAQGVSRKANCEGCASMYYSIPRISVEASLSRDGVKHELHGLAWMDHEFMTNSLGKSQVGWDWFGLMLKDGRSLMLFQVRNDRNEVDFASGGVRSGEIVRELSASDFKLTPLGRWRSQASGAEYPIEWRVTIPAEGIDVVVKARVAPSELGGQQQLSTSASQDGAAAIRYWEGPVAAADESVIGYLEMTGYAGGVGGL